MYEFYQKFFNKDVIKLNFYQKSTEFLLFQLINHLKTKYLSICCQNGLKIDFVYSVACKFPHVYMKSLMRDELFSHCVMCEFVSWLAENFLLVIKFILFNLTVKYKDLS